MDRGKIIRQGPIAELLEGTALALEVDCADPERARALLPVNAAFQSVKVEPHGLAITMAAGTSKDAVAEVNRVLVEGGIAVYRLQVVQESLENWFLSVTSRLGEEQ